MTTNLINTETSNITTWDFIGQGSCPKACNRTGDMVIWSTIVERTDDAEIIHKCRWRLSKAQAKCLLEELRRELTKE